MSLLTDNAIRAIQARTQTTVRGFPYPATQQPLRKGRAIAEAQQAKALKAVAEWLGKLDREGMGEWVYIKDSDEELLREGKMPGEE